MIKSIENIAKKEKRVKCVCVGVCSVCVVYVWMCGCGCGCASGCVGVWVFMCVGVCERLNVEPV